MSKALQALGLPDTASPEEVKAKWRQLCMGCHPDRGGDAAEFDKINKAYKQAMMDAAAPKPCGACGGVGKVRHSHGFSGVDLACTACGGSGYVQ